MIARLGRSLYQAFLRFNRENYSYYAATLAFTTALTLVPLCSITLFLSTGLPVFAKTIDLIKEYVYANFVPASRTLIASYLDEFSQQAVKLPLSGIIISFITVLSLIALVKNVINSIWHFPVYKSHVNVILHWLIILSVPAGIIFGICVSYYVLEMSWMYYASSVLTIIMITSLLPLIINVVAFTTLYRVTPNYKPSWTSSLIGGITAAILFEIAKKIFVVYLGYATSYELIYGAASVIPVFLFWLYISWMIVIYGAMTANIYDDETIE